MTAVQMLYIIILLLPILLAFAFGKFRYLRIRSKLLEVGMLYIALMVYLGCNEFHRILGAQKGFGNAFFDLPLSYLTGLAIVFAGLKWGNPDKTRLLRVVAATAAALAWFFLTPHYGK